MENKTTQTNEPIKITNKKVKKQKNKYKVLLYLVLPIMLISVAFNVLSLVNVLNKDSNISINLCDNLSTDVSNNLLIGENYV